jgi:hypothetical protein
MLHAMHRSARTDVAEKPAVERTVLSKRGRTPLCSVNNGVTRVGRAVVDLVGERVVGTLDGAAVGALVGVRVVGTLVGAAVVGALVIARFVTVRAEAIDPTKAMNKTVRRHLVVSIAEWLFDRSGRTPAKGELRLNVAECSRLLKLGSFSTRGNLFCGLFGLRTTHNLGKEWARSGVGQKRVRSISAWKSESSQRTDSTHRWRRLMSSAPTYPYAARLCFLRCIPTAADSVLACLIITVAQHSERTAHSATQHTTGTTARRYAHAGSRARTRAT